MNEPLDPPLCPETDAEKLVEAQAVAKSLARRLQYMAKDNKQLKASAASFARWKMEELARQGRDAEAAKVEKELKLLEI